MGEPKQGGLKQGGLKQGGPKQGGLPWFLKARVLTVKVKASFFYLTIIKIMKLWENLKKFGVPVLLGSLTVDGWFTSRKASFKDKYLEEALKKGMIKEKALEEANKKAEDTIQMLKIKLTATSDRLDTSIKNVNDYSEKMGNISKELINNTADPKELEPLKSKLKFYKEMYDQEIKKQDICIKEMKSLSNTNDPDIVKSDLSEVFNNIIDNYREFLSTLTSEQMVIVFNILGYIILLITLTNITTLLIGDQLINFLKLESKYPKLAKYIKLKQILNKHYLRFYIVIFYILLLLLISINIFMFSFDYIYKFFI